jgi:hypothetical protein
MRESGKDRDKENKRVRVGRAVIEADNMRNWVRGAGWDVGAGAAPQEQLEADWMSGKGKAGMRAQGGVGGVGNSHELFPAPKLQELTGADPPPQ